MKRKYQALHLIKLARHLMEIELTTDDITLIKALKEDNRNTEFFGCFPFVFNLLPVLFEQ